MKNEAVYSLSLSLTLGKATIWYVIYQLCNNCFKSKPLKDCFKTKPPKDTHLTIIQTNVSLGCYLVVRLCNILYVEARVYHYIRNTVV